MLVSDKLRSVEVNFGKAIEYRIADTGGAFQFVLGVRKSGSSILNSIVTALAEMNDVNYVDIAGKLFKEGISVETWQSSAELRRIIRGGNVYGGFRNAPLGLLKGGQYASVPKILLVRDPRDALVSEYFSNAYSHSLPAEGTAREQLLTQRASALSRSVEDYVLARAPDMRKTLLEYLAIMEYNDVIVMKYEDYILRKRDLISTICDVFGWKVSDVQVANILSWADVVPKSERPTEFVRRVTPGDHKEKLGVAAIQSLEQLLGREMRAFGYKPNR